MSLGIDVERHYLLYWGADVLPEAEGFRDWYDTHEQLMSKAIRLTPLDESLTRWTVTEYQVDEHGQFVINGNDLVTRERIITTTPGRPHWLIECDLTTCDDA